MIEGFVNDGLEPVVELELVTKGETEKVFAIVDTGFNGYLCLAENQIDKMDLTYVGTDLFELGNGEIVENDVFSGRIVFDERECNVLAIISTSSDVLIGTSLLKTKTFLVDFVDRTVRIKDKEVT
jgi:clan AA aspartic protease